MIKNILNKNSNSLNKLQTDCLYLISNFFDNNKLEEIKNENYFFIGLRGKFVDKENFCVNFSFLYESLIFEFFLSYDQLEYYISKEGEILKKCNIEDFWNDEEMLQKFTAYLSSDMQLLGCF